MPLSIAALHYMIWARQHDESRLCKYCSALVVFQRLGCLLVLRCQTFAVSAPGCIELCYQKFTTLHCLLKICVPADGDDMLCFFSEARVRA